MNFFAESRGFFSISSVNLWGNRWEKELPVSVVHKYRQIGYVLPVGEIGKKGAIKRIGKNLYF
jgi:hypothetical protein